MKCMRLLAFSVLVALALGCGGKDGSGDRNGGTGTSGSGAGTGVGAGTTAGAAAGASGGTSGTTGGGTAGDGTAGTAVAGSGVAGTGVPADPFAGNNAVTPGMICDRMSTIQCAGEVTCCDTPRPYADCKSAMMSGCMDMLFLDQIAMNAVTGFDPVAAEAAFTQYEALARACDQNVANWGVSMTGLRSILKGTVDAGKGCGVKASASDSANAAALASCKNGATHACMFRPIGIGGSISVPSTWMCDPRGVVDDDCFTDANCQDGLYCDNPDVGFEAKCKTRKTAGQPCAYPNECASLFCKKKVCVDVSQQAAYCLVND
jgi:hypothetical protein